MSPMTLGREDDASETTPLVLENGDGPRTSAVQTPRCPSAPSAAPCSGAASSTGFNKVVAVTMAGGAAITYITLSSSMILFNKFLMRPDVFPFPVTLTSLHMLCSLSMGLGLQRFCPALFPAYARVFHKQCGAQLDHASDNEEKANYFTHVTQALLPFAPIAACGAVSLVTGNSAYEYASVSFLQMVKESHVMFVYVLMLMVGLDVFKYRMAAVIIFITMSAMVAVYGEILFSWQGLTLQLVSGFAASGQIVLNNLLMTRSSVGKIDPLTLVLCTAPVMLVVLIPANFVFWDARIPGLLRLWLPFLAGNAMLAFALQVSAATLIWVCSGTGYALASVAKDLAIVAAAQALLHESFTWVQVLGFAGSISGMAIYSLMKLFPEAF